MKKKSKKSRMVARQAHIEFFEAQVFFFWDCKPSEVVTFIKKNFRPDYPAHITDYLKSIEQHPPQGVTLNNPGRSAHCLIWLAKPPKERMDVLTHEIAHATHMIMKHWSIELTDDTQEVYAMLVGHITKGALTIK